VRDFRQKPVSPYPERWGDPIFTWGFAHHQNCCGQDNYCTGSQLPKTGFEVFWMGFGRAMLGTEQVNSVQISSANQFFRWFGSLKLGVWVLSILAVVLIAATLYESKTTTREVQILVYQSWWFITLLGFLGVNVFCAAMARYPWKAHQTGFVLTHLGLLVLLLGSIIGLVFGIEGSVTLVEGGPPQRFFSQEYEVLNIAQVGSDRFIVAPLKYSGDNPAALAGRKLRVRPLPIEAQVQAYHPHTRETLVVEPGGDEDNPALRFSLVMRMGDTNQPPVEVTEWLVAADPRRRALSLGPAVVRLEPVASEEALQQRLRPPPKTAASGKGLLELNLNQKSLAIPVEENLGREFKSPEGDITVVLKEYFADFRMDEQNRRPMSVSDQPNNPTILFEARSATGRIVGFAFANYPEMGLIRQEEGTNQAASALYRFERTGQDARNTLTLLAGPGNQLHYTASSSRAGHEAGELKIGQAVPLSWMTNATFAVKEFIEKPRISTRQVPVPHEGDALGTSPAIELQLRQQGTTRDVMARWGDPQRVSLADVTYELLYGYAMIPLGFSIELKKFAAPKYEGTAMPAGFESYVKVQDLKTGDALEKRIWMNHPLTYQGYRISQASYEMGADGAPNRSILQVMRDPGYPFKGIGSVLIVLGIMVTFYFRKQPATGSGVEAGRATDADS
jgi:hypothetical protein